MSSPAINNLPARHFRFDDSGAEPDPRAVTELVRAVAAADPAIIPAPASDNTLAAWFADATRPPWWTVHVYENDTLVATVRLIQVDDPGLDGIAVVHRLLVHPAYRSDGLGRELLSRCVRRARTVGKRAGMETKATQRTAIRLLHSEGWREVGMRSGSDGTPIIDFLAPTD